MYSEKHAFSRTEERKVSFAALSLKWMGTDTIHEREKKTRLLVRFPAVLISPSWIRFLGEAARIPHARFLQMNDRSVA
jgi:hypothetical protein